MTYTDNFIILPYEGDIKGVGEIIGPETVWKWKRVSYEPWG